MKLSDFGRLIKVKPQDRFPPVSVTLLSSLATYKIKSYHTQKPEMERDKSVISATDRYKYLVTFRESPSRSRSLCHSLTQVTDRVRLGVGLIQFPRTYAHTHTGRLVTLGSKPGKEFAKRGSTYQNYEVGDGRRVQRKLPRETGARTQFSGVILINLAMMTVEIVIVKCRLLPPITKSL